MTVEILHQPVRQEDRRRPERRVDGPWKAGERSERQHRGPSRREDAEPAAAADKCVGELERRGIGRRRQKEKPGGEVSRLEPVGHFIRDVRNALECRPAQDCGDRERPPGEDPRQPWMRLRRPVPEVPRPLCRHGARQRGQQKEVSSGGRCGERQPEHVFPSPRSQHGPGEHHGGEGDRSAREDGSNGRRDTAPAKQRHDGQNAAEGEDAQAHDQPPSRLHQADPPESPVAGLRERERAGERREIEQREEGYQAGDGPWRSGDQRRRDDRWLAATHSP